MGFIREAGRWADRLSANIELPTDKSLQYLAPQKSGKLIFGAMKDTLDAALESEENKRKVRLAGLREKEKLYEFAPAGQSTQLIVGATEETDKTIIGLSGALYKKYAMRRVYYSAFIPVGTDGRPGISDPRLPDTGGLITGNDASGAPLSILRREHRLYQADWLLRFYHFTTDEILDDESPFLDPHLDPKTVWALKHLDFFPVEINRADYETLLRVPGIGAKTARRVIESRRSRALNLENLRRIGAVMKRAKYFVTASGDFAARPSDPKRIRRMLTDADNAGLQLPLFDF
jgi:predicted DNA-binding helix-hairpin-helix protein